MNNPILNILLNEINEMPEFCDMQNITVNTKGIWGNYPLHIVCTWCDQSSTQLLLDNGAKINCVGEWGETPIFRAIRSANRSAKFVTFLIKSGADLTVKSVMFQVTPLELAEERSYTTLIDVIKNGMDF